MGYNLKIQKSLHRPSLYRIDNIGQRLNIGRFQEPALFKILSDQKNYYTALFPTGKRGMKNE